MSLYQLAFLLLTLSHLRLVQHKIKKRILVLGLVLLKLPLYLLTLWYFPMVNFDDISSF